MEEPAEKKNKKTEKKTAQRGPGAGASISTTPSTTRTNWRRGLLRKTTTTRDGCVAHMLLRSCRDVRRPRHLPNAKLTAMVQSHPDGTMKNKSRTTLFRRTPDQGGTPKSSKKQTKIMHFFIRTYQVYHIYVCAEIQPQCTC